eukprot:scaffold114_cov175-Amphora_coffeaeformis.AAC.5
MGGAYGMAGRKPLHLGAQRGDAPAMVKCLLQHGADVHVVDMDGHTALHVAVLAGHTEVGRLLLRAQGGARLTWSVWASKRRWRGRTAVPIVQRIARGLMDDLRLFDWVILWQDQTVVKRAFTPGLLQETYIKSS